jgi:uncharacterized coiled-coil DUF342 family protein
LEDEKKQNAKCIADLEAKLAAQAEAHGFEMSKLKETFDEVRKKIEVKKPKCEIVEAGRGRVQKNIDELRESKERCFSITAECCEKYVCWCWHFF